MPPAWFWRKLHSWQNVHRAVSSVEDLYELNLHEIAPCAKNRVVHIEAQNTHYMIMNIANTTTAPCAIKTNGKIDRAAWLCGGSTTCSTQPEPPKHFCRLVLLGAPGVGKGTQAELLHGWTGACHLSTGDIFRAAKNLPADRRGPALENAIGYMKRGELVPDTTVLDIVRERVRCLRCHGGFLLDGFPRTVTQAEALAELLKSENLPLTAVIDYELPLPEIVERLSGRRVCDSCKGTFHISNKSVTGDDCPSCTGRLYQREDDRPEAIRVRMEAYRSSTEPLIEFYRRSGLLVSISAEGTPEEIFQRTVEALSGRLAK